ncbi:MAG: GNAT family N-acetyltransferase [Paracoccaceae bacterium]
MHALLDELSLGQGPDLNDVSEVAARVLEEPSLAAFLAYAGAEPVGVIVLNSCCAIYAGGEFGEISELYVEPALRSSGVAAQLLDAARAEGRSRGWSRLEVGAPDQPAWARTLEFYRRNGFGEVGPRLRCLLKALICNEKGPPVREARNVRECRSSGCDGRGFL